MTHTDTEVEGLGRRVANARAARRWSLRQLADRAQVSRNQISLVEQGKSNPSVELVSRLAYALGVGMGELLGLGEGEMGEFVRTYRRLSVDGRLLVEDFARLVEMREGAAERHQLPVRVLPDDGGAITTLEGESDGRTEAVG